jgi:hypothetical protein
MVPAAATAADAPPDWPTLSTDLTCPLCGYNLRGLADPRCPECGFAFRWGELLDAKRDRHPWLFEHGRRPWSPPRRALRLTAWRAGLRPWRFWRDVSPTNPVHAGRLVAYWVLTTGPIALLVLTAIVAQLTLAARATAAYRAQWTPWPGHPGQFRYEAAPANAAPDDGYTASQAELDQWTPPPWTERFAATTWHDDIRDAQGPVLAVAGVAAAWPWLTAAALLVFQASLRRAKVRPAHVLRVGIYSADVGLLAVAVAVAVFGPGSLTTPVVQSLPAALQAGVPRWLMARSPLGEWLGRASPVADLMNRWGVPVLVAVVVPFSLVSTLRLAVAYRRYMRFDRPLATAVAAQAIVVLIVIVAILQLTRAV